MHESQQTPHTARPDRQPAEPCTACGAEVADPVDGGLSCATCGQWYYLCDACMPHVYEHSRDAAWLCPECREPTLH